MDRSFLMDATAAMWSCRVGVPGLSSVAGVSGFVLCWATRINSSQDAGRNRDIINAGVVLRPCQEEMLQYDEYCSLLEQQDRLQGRFQ